MKHFDGHAGGGNPGVQVWSAMLRGTGGRAGLGAFGNPRFTNKFAYDLNANRRAVSPTSCQRFHQQLRTVGEDNNATFLRHEDFCQTTVDNGACPDTPVVGLDTGFNDSIVIDQCSSRFPDPRLVKPFSQAQFRLRSTGFVFRKAANR